MALSSDTFWDATPRELDALGRVHRAHRDVGHQRWAAFMAAFYNANFTKQNGHFTVEDFGVKLLAKPEQTAEEYWRSKYKQDEGEKRAILGQAFGGAKPDAP